MRRKLTWISVLAWATIATALLLWSVVGSPPWEQQGRCLDALLRAKNYDNFILPTDWDPTERRAIQRMFLEKATEDAKRWCA